MIEKSIKDIKGSDNEIKLLAKVIAKSNNQKITEKIVAETVKKGSTNKTLMAKVATETIKENKNQIQKLATTVSSNQVAVQNLTVNKQLINTESIGLVFLKNVSPN